MIEGDFRKTFGTVEVLKRTGVLVVRENPRPLLLRIGLNVFVIIACFAVASFLWMSSEDQGIAGGAFQWLGLVIGIIGIIAFVSLVQLCVFIQHPIVIDRTEKTVKRGKRVHVEGKLKAMVKSVAGRESNFHVRVGQKDRAMFLWRTQNEGQAREMAALVNSYLGNSLADAEVGEDSFDHVG